MAPAVGQALQSRSNMEVFAHGLVPQQIPLEHRLGGRLNHQFLLRAAGIARVDHVGVIRLFAIGTDGDDGIATAGPVGVPVHVRFGCLCQQANSPEQGDATNIPHVLNFPPLPDRL
ncbi:conserved hypothetical protein [Ricinus communis]|uniref:Uncharacterized protein n=1 Tax=Ricinus communis TaxID=3988 RepID=B9TGK3_RICCO|nr:conserved hypothetical protein [Ricinus communis]